MSCVAVLLRNDIVSICNEQLTRDIALVRKKDVVLADDVVCFYFGHLFRCVLYPAAVSLRAVVHAMTADVRFYDSLSAVVKVFVFAGDVSMMKEWLHYHMYMSFNYLEPSPQDHI